VVTRWEPDVKFHSLNAEKSYPNFTIKTKLSPNPLYINYNPNRNPINPFKPY